MKYLNIEFTFIEQLENVAYFIMQDCKRMVIVGYGILRCESFSFFAFAKLLQFFFSRCRDCQLEENVRRFSQMI